MLIYDGISQKYGHITCEVDFWHKPSTLILTICVFRLNGTANPR